jgi:hypothetical protein
MDKAIAKSRPQFINQFFDLKNLEKNLDWKEMIFHPESKLKTLKLF